MAEQKSYPRVYRMEGFLNNYFWLRVYERPKELVGSVTSDGRISNYMRYEHELDFPWIDVTDDPEVQEGLKQSQHLVRS